MPGFPNMFLLYGPNTNGGTGSVIYVIEAGVTHVIAALDALGRARAERIEVSRERTESSTTSSRAALARKAGTRAARAGMSTRAATTSQWPWTWSTYRAERGSSNGRLQLTARS